MVGPRPRGAAGLRGERPHPGHRSTAPARADAISGALAGGAGGDPTGTVAQADDGLPDLAEREHARHDEDYRAGHREGRAEPVDHRPRRPALASGALARDPGGDPAEGSRQDPADGSRQAAQPRAVSGRGRRAVADGPGGEAGGRGADHGDKGLTPHDGKPAEHHELIAQQPPLPVEPRLAEPFADLRQAVSNRLDAIRRRVQYAAEEILEVAFLCSHAPRSRPLWAPLTLLTSPTPGRPAALLRRGRYGF